MADGTGGEMGAEIPQEVIDRATQMGWQPRESYRGDPERFVEADKFVQRGEELMPILRQNNKKLEADLRAREAEIARLASLVSQNQKDIERLDEHHAEETKRKLVEQKARLKRELALAHKEDDDEAVAQITDELIELGQRPAPEAKKPAAETAPVPRLLPAEQLEWQRQNPWFGQDEDKDTACLIIGARLQRKGLRGAEFYKQLDVELDKQFPKARPTGGKVEESGRGSSSAAGGGGKGFGDLPPEAKKKCNEQARMFVGKGKRYEKLADWQSTYATRYFDQE